ncbi:unnamed protein product [Amoebophrya sp. A120]|nr:unnamed protein product [Amoebophrya sp. A120]|eukprot:GSA120T00026391001.1
MDMARKGLSLARHVQHAFVAPAPRTRCRKVFKGLEKCTQSMARSEEAAPCLVCMRNFQFPLCSSGDKKVRLLLPLQEGQIFVHCRLRSITSCSVSLLHQTQTTCLQCITFFPSQRGPAQGARATGAGHRTLCRQYTRLDGGKSDALARGD